MRNVNVCCLLVFFVAIMYPFTRQQMEDIGKKIWRNECGCSGEKLLFWSSLEPFPSLGIGHFIWYPAGYKGPYTQDFPNFIMYLRQQGIALSSWIGDHCPWSTRELFYQSSKTPAIQELRTLLETTIALQAEYMVDKLRMLIPEILENTPTHMREKTKTIIDQLSNTEQGLYVLVDYLNFKGSGLNSKERYKGQGWGLMQALHYMITHNLPVTPASFASAAEYLLRQRVTNAPADSSDEQRIAGWLNRLKTYDPA